MDARTTILEGNEHDTLRLARTHPADHVNPAPDGPYNLVVIGAGSGGLISALIASSLGARVALVEQGLLGGDCLNAGCVPSKGVIRAARMQAEAERARALGLPLAQGARIDFAAAMERMRALRTEIAAEDSVERYREEFGVEIYLGRARFRGDGHIAVEGPAGDRDLRYVKAVVATGARAFVPPIDGLAETGYRTNETIFHLTANPGRLAVIGGGPIGAELAQAFHRLGAAVAVFEQGPRILPRADADAAQVVADALSREGVGIHAASKVVRVERKGEEKVLHFEGPDGGHRQWVADEILVAVGRAPNVEGLGLETVGVEHDVRAGIAVDDRLRTTNRRIFAVGDVALDAKFTHAADAAAKIAVQNALFAGRKKVSDLVMPWCTYTSPEVAGVGLSEAEAQAKGVEVDTWRVALREVNRAVLDGDEDGFVTIRTRKGRDEIVGATVVAEHAGEWISQVTQAMVNGNGLASFSGVIFPYPTQAEALKRASGQLMRGRLTPRIERLFAAWFHLRRKRS
jgi:pyruvate/2-oxoglutarate dehydrogenase complex dihydrolipoamide dehydrogenase (E3) component